MKELTEFWVEGARDAEKMWQSHEDKHRAQILTALSCVPPFKSVYEIGCGAGPNLRRIIHARPGVIVGGSEPNESLAAWASEHLGVPIEREQMPWLPVSTWDVTISCYAMAYVDAEIVKVILRNVRSRNFIILEPTAGVTPFGNPELYQSHDKALPFYVHDYATLAESAGWRTLWRWPLYPHHMGLNVVLTLERT
jgi:hypothetical protein